MTVTVTGVVKNVSGEPDRSKWVFTSVLRESGDVDSSIVSTNLVVATPNAEGLLTVELDPGPVIVRYGSTVVTVTVPDVDNLELWDDLLSVAVNMPPGTPDQKLAAAVAAYLESHPVAVGALTDLGITATVTELNYVDGVTSAIQTQVNGKAATSHTHTSSQVTDFTEAAQDAINSLLAGASGVTLSYNDAANTLTITGGGAGGLDAEAVRDAMGVAMVGAGLISVTVNDAADTITLSTTATANDTDANLKARANHTGTQPVSSIAASTSTALGVGSLEVGHASDTTLSRSAAGVLAVEGVVVPTVSSVDTLTNKRITPRTPAVTAGATPAVNTDVTDVVVITGLTVNITSMTSGLTGTPNSEQPLRFAITGTAARTISWGTSFEDGAVTLPTTTVTTQRLDVGFFWNAATSKWRCMASGSA